MKHTTEELILAAHIRELALKVRDSELAQALKAWDKTSMEPDDDEGREKRAAFKSSWLASNDVTSFAKPALERIAAVADAIREGL